MFCLYDFSSMKFYDSDSDYIINLHILCYVSWDLFSDTLNIRISFSQLDYMILITAIILKFDIFNVPSHI